jgi:hypothetical protein
LIFIRQNVIWRCDDRAEVAHGLGGVAKSAEGADLGHGFLGSASFDERVRGGLRADDAATAAPRRASYDSRA